MHICTVVGARPQFVKAAVVSRALREHGGLSCRESVIHTGQHFDSNMSEVFFRELDIPHPAHCLGIGGGTHGQNTGRMIEAIEAILQKQRPDWVLVYGDTDSTLAGTLAAVKLHLRVAHVEAGLRSFNRAMPEEINRILTDHASEVLFTPTDTATKNLAREGIAGGVVRQVGDVMFDAALYYGKRAEERSSVLQRLGISCVEYCLATLHRAENTDDEDRLRKILDGFARTNRTIVWPVHPRARRRIAEFGLVLPENVHAIDPVGYLDITMLQRHALLVATDSGGMQKEAYFNGVRCVTLREETEWVELIELGVNELVGCDPTRIAAGFASAISGSFERPSSSGPFGSGNAAQLVASYLLSSNASPRVL